MLHVYPLSEESIHDLEGTCCQCGVIVQWDLPEALVIHQRLRQVFNPGEPDNTLQPAWTPQVQDRFTRG